ncbi:nuclear transport factor 2 family protein [Mycobacterium shigaense]|uniref:SnoaL-like domain-containing protein n=1 Tax=Mycobacterium shigaense TaxID=722731 RepID=A0A1Z4EB73_9MYCO|nr:nuclear transport factor 2 family protein [Mycobacterium shigaense]MEA1121469.1 nuclear transport factor 2 family protein [Mycobacterium shigaense]BAX90196.1 hypothetical protein MSG_00029 [Mycobacterium shigaense]
MSIPDPEAFTRSWLDAWNAHDVERVLQHFADDVVFTSPVAVRVLNDSNGVVRGKDALRAYWLAALQRIPDLHFELIGVYVGVQAIIINYRNQTGAMVNEVLIFDETGLIREGHGTYVEEILED